MGIQMISVKLRSTKNQNLAWNVTLQSTLEHPINIVECIRLFDALRFTIMNDPVCETKNSLSSADKVFQFVIQSDFSLPPEAPAEQTESILEQLIMRALFEKQPYDGYDILSFALLMTQRGSDLVRAWVAYCCQIYSGYPKEHILQWILSHLQLVSLLFQYFEAKFDPKIDNRHALMNSLEQNLTQALSAIPSISIDRAFRAIFSVIQATVRTNYYQKDLFTQFPKAWISFKVNPALIPDIALPRMLFEIFVWHPLCEGVHLRMGRIARGGIRWSDRLDDYRTEIMGLVKTQHVKNTLIVPAGSKGGFILHRPQDQGQMQAATMAYQIFISGLLDLTDRTLNAQHPLENTVCYDDHDPYLVVAADKGTASFSDLANAISLRYGFWLKDAFASGGSQGYDHKKIGITAKGAFISAAHHCRNLGIDHQKPLTVVGIGDLSGDVFGNGATLWPEMKLVAAFNHQHIFIDPDPRPESYQERLRMFALPKSSWSDYQRDLISPGGGIFLRSDKEIQLSPQMQIMFQTNQEKMSPEEIIQSILCMKVDMIFNGGIGTYFKAEAEGHEAARDKANDSVRVNAESLQTAMLIEGGNLGSTQAARIAFSRRGGKVNTDGLDNSGGVDCSDHEVNLKIFIDDLIQKELFLEDRQQFLQSCTQDVAQLVLRHNLEQNRVISMAEFVSRSQMRLQKDVFDDLVARQVLNPRLEGFSLIQEIDQHFYFTRPELIVLMGYIKIDLKKRLLADPQSRILCQSQWIARAFPSICSEKYGSFLKDHPLAYEIALTHLINYWIHRVGLTFAYRMQVEMQCSLVELIQASLQAFEIFQLDQKIEEIEQLGHHISFDQRYHAMIQWNRLIYRVTRWLLSHPKISGHFSENKICFLEKQFEMYQACCLGQESSQPQDENILQKSQWATERFAVVGLLFDQKQEESLQLIQVFLDVRKELMHSQIEKWIESLPTKTATQAQTRAWLRDDHLSCQQKLAKHLHQKPQLLNQPEIQQFFSKWKKILEWIPQKQNYTADEIFVFIRNLERMTDSFMNSTRN